MGSTTVCPSRVFALMSRTSADSSKYRRPSFDTLHRGRHLRTQQQFSRDRLDQAAGLVGGRCESEPAEACQRDGQDEPAHYGKMREENLQMRNGSAEEVRVPPLQRSDVIPKGWTQESLCKAMAGPPP